MDDAPQVEVIEIQEVPKPPEPRNCFKEPGITNLVGHRVLISDIDACLERNKGDRSSSAKELNFTRRRLTDAINQNKELKLKWGKYSMAGPNIQLNSQEAPNETNTISREPLVPTTKPDPLVKADLALAAQIAREDAKVKKGILGLGGSEEEADLALSLQKFHGRHIESTLSLTTSGLALNFQRMMRVARKLEERIQAGGFSHNEYGDPVEERLVMESYRGILEECRRTTELCLRGSLVKAKIEQMRTEGSAARAGKRPKPGFRPKGDTTNNIIAKQVVVNP